MPRSRCVALRCFLLAVFASPVMNWASASEGLESVRVDMRCGLYCLAAALGALDLTSPSIEELEGRLGQPSPLGYSMDQLAEVATSYGAHTLGVKTSLENLERRRGRFACIALLDQKGHYVCIYNVDKKSVYLVDPPLERTVSRDAFSRLWDGKALLVSSTRMDPNPRGSRTVWAAALAAGVMVLGFWIGVTLIRRRRGS